MHLGYFRATAHTWNADNLPVRKVRPAAHVPLRPGLVEPRRFLVLAQSPISARVPWGQRVPSSAWTCSFGGLHKSRGSSQTCESPQPVQSSQAVGDPQILGKESNPPNKPFTGRFGQVTGCRSPDWGSQNVILQKSLLDKAGEATKWIKHEKLVVY